MPAALRPFLIVVVLVLALAPLGLPPFAMTLLTEALILGLFAMSLDLMVGYTRLISFGHAAAYGLGAYACGCFLLHTGMPLLFAVLAAALLTGVVAIGVGWVCTLATGVSFSMLTLAFAQLLYAISFKWTSVTGGSDGLAGIPRTPGPFGFAALTQQGRLLLPGARLPARRLPAVLRPGALAVRRGAARHPRERGQDDRRWATTRASTRSPWWRSPTRWAASPARSTRRSRASPTPSCCSGCCRGQVLIMVIVGGSGTLVGPILGAAFFMLMEHQLSSWTEAWALFFGLIFIAFVLFAPQGIWGLATGRAGRRRGGHRSPDVALLELDGLTRRFGALVAARPRHHAGRGRRGARRHRSERRRQDDAVQRHHRHGQADRGSDPLRRPGDRRPGQPSDLPARHVAHLPDHRAVSRNVGARERPAGGPGAPCAGAGSRSAARAIFAEARRAAMRRWNSSASPASPSGRPACCRTATSACSRSRWRWRSSRACCCSTSRRRACRSRRRPQAVETLARLPAGRRA